MYFTNIDRVNFHFMHTLKHVASVHTCAEFKHTLPVFGVKLVITKQLNYDITSGHCTTITKLLTEHWLKSKTFYIHEQQKLFTAEFLPLKFICRLYCCPNYVQLYIDGHMFLFALKNHMISCASLFFPIVSYI